VLCERRLPNRAFPGRFPADYETWSYLARIRDAAGQSPQRRSHNTSHIDIWQESTRNRGCAPDNLQVSARCDDEVVDDLRIGRIGRALRHRFAWRQADLGERVGLSQSQISLFERGRFEGMSIRTIRHIVAAMDAELVLTVRWRGGDLDRLLDAVHARLGDDTAQLLRADAWEIAPEVSYSVYGERGSIDILGWHPGYASLLVVEVKSEIASIEATLRKHDEKARLAARIADERFGWHADVIARLLVLPDHRTVRRQVEDKAALFAGVYPARNVAVRRWLKAPAGPMSGILFLPDSSAARGLAVRPVRKRARLQP
jgi:transcriptional regulator with XRE-family HTH domain